MDQCTLRGARFHKPDFSHAYSRKTVSTRATFRACNLELADLAEARLPGCDLTGSRLREADLSGADLTGATLRDCDLFQADLTRARLAEADLRGAEISGLNLLQLASFAGLRIDAAQQHQLLAALGVEIETEPTR
jgi:fluoroquinolone resistance protein